MRASDLPTPGILSNGQTLRHETAHAISRAEINADRSVTSDTAEQLRLFFEDCARKANDIIATGSAGGTRASDLLSPGTLSNGQTLRHTAAHALARAQINADRSPSSTTAADLLLFFLAASTFVGGDGNLGGAESWIEFVNGEGVLNFSGAIDYDTEVPAP